MTPTYTYPVLPPEPVSQAHDDKIYLVTHAGLSAGYQIAQTAHVMAELASCHANEFSRWNHHSNSLIVVEAPNAHELSTLISRARIKNLRYEIFREPDLGDEITAVAFIPQENYEGTMTPRKFLSNYPLAGKKLHNQKFNHEREHRLRTMSFAMMDCDQTEGQNVLQHGRSVREHYFALVEHLHENISLHQASNWLLPDWVDEYREQIVASLPEDYIMDRYLTLHDCGKPKVREVDEAGRVHFPNHALASEQVYRETLGNEAIEDVAYLIAHDMDAHLLKAVDIPAFASHPLAVAQLLAALSEVTSNAAMFGGINSTGFKIKYKHINQRGKALMKLLFDE